MRDFEPWIESIKSDDRFVDAESGQSGVFFSRHDEYFLFPLQPVCGDGTRRTLGFIICDLSFHPHKHRTGSGYPNLQAASVVLNLLAGIWRHREDARTYFYTLKCLDAIRHGQNTLNSIVAEFGALQHMNLGGSALGPPIANLEQYAKRLGEAARICDGQQEQYEWGVSVAQLRDCLIESCEEERARHGVAWRNVICQVREGAYNGGVRIPVDDLRSVLSCILNNAVAHGGSQHADACRWTLTRGRGQCTRPAGVMACASW